MTNSIKGIFDKLSVIMSRNADDICLKYDLYDVRAEFSDNEIRIIEVSDDTDFLYPDYEFVGVSIEKVDNSLFVRYHSEDNTYDSGNYCVAETIDVRFLSDLEAASKLYYFVFEKC